MKSKLGMDLDIERAHRVERKPKANDICKPDFSKPRTIVCRLRDWKQKDEVIRKARKETPRGLHISEDLALATLQKRESLVPKLKEAREAGKIALLFYFYFINP